MSLDRWIALVLISIFVVYGYTAFFLMDNLLPPILKRNPIWPSTFPKVLSVLGIVFSLFILFRFEKETSQKKEEIDLKNFFKYKIIDTSAFIFFMILYAFLLRNLGFLLSTFLFLFSGSCILGEKRIIRSLSITLIATFFIWYLVNTVLGIYLSPFPEFINNYLIGIK